MKFDPENNTGKFIPKFREFFTCYFFLSNMSVGILTKEMNPIVTSTENDGNLNQTNYDGIKIIGKWNSILHFDTDNE